MTNNPDLLLTAGFDDETSQFFQRLEDNFDRMAGLSNRANQQVGSGAGQSAVKLGALAGAVAGVTSQLTKMALQAAMAFPALISESIQIAAQSQAASVALGVVAEKAGYTAEEINALKQEMIDIGVAEETAVDTLLKLAGAEQDLTKAVDLARVAQNAAAVSGKSDEESITRMTHSIITKNTEMTRDMQLGVDRTKMVKEYTKATGIAAKEIDNRTLVELYLNGVIEAGIKLEGAHTNVLGTAAGTAQSTAQQIRGLKKALGDVFLPAYTLLINEWSGAVADMGVWVENNKASLTEWAAMLGGTVQVLIDATKATLSFIVALHKLTGGATTLEELFVKPGKDIIALLYGLEEAEKRVDALGTTTKQAGVLLAASFAAGLAMIREFVTLLVEGATVADKAFKVLTGRASMDVLENSIKGFSDQWENFGDNVMADAQVATENAMKAFGMIDEEAVPAAEKTAEAVEEISTALEDAETKVKELNKAFADEMAKVAKQRGRAAIDQAIRESRQREDIERRHQERLEDIVKNAKDRAADVIAESDEAVAALAQEQIDQRAALEQNRADQMIDIELDYRRRLEDIQRDYLYSVDEAARKNDAVAILRLMRENKKKLGEEKIAQDRRKEDATFDYKQQLTDLQTAQAARRQEISRDREERLAELDQELADALRKAEEQREKDYENLDRSLQRQREDRLRHYAWEDEDRLAAHEAELRELGEHFAGVEGLTRAHLESLLAEHGIAIQGLDILWDAYSKRQSGRAWNVPGVPSPDKWEKQRESEIKEDIGSGRTSKEWEFATGGAAIVSRPTNVMIGEGGPEAMFAMPLGGMQQHRLGGDLNVNVHGVSAQMEQQIAPVIYEILEGLFAPMG